LRVHKTIQTYMEVKYTRFAQLQHDSD
jgi:hypothetical protein